MPYQLDLFTGVPCAGSSAPAGASAPVINARNDAEELLLDLLAILENELHHSGNARLLAAEIIRLYFEADRP